MQGVRAFNAEVHARAFHAVFYYACSKSLSCRGGPVPDSHARGAPKALYYPPQLKAPGSTYLTDHTPRKP